MKVFTIGFTKRSARDFFETVCGSGARRVVDVRLNNVSQLAGFTKRDDLAYFLKAICGLDYVHLPILAPTQEIIDAYRKQHTGWEPFSASFLALLAERRVEDEVPREVIDGGILLCSEHDPKPCHRRLVAEYLDERWGGLEVEHL